MKKTQTFGLAFLSGTLMWLAWPPHAWLAPLLLISLVPLFVALNALESSSRLKKGKQIFLTAGLCFLVFNTASIYWVYNALSSFNEGVSGAIIAFFVSLIPYGLGALLMTFAFWLFYRLKRYLGKYLSYIALISFYVAMEYLHQTWDLAFPWMNLGNGFASTHQLIQWYEFTGVYGGTVWVLIANIFAFETYMAYRVSVRRMWFVLGGWVLVIALPILLSLQLYSRYKEKSVPVNVVVVQPNIDPYLRYGGIPISAQLDILTKLSDSVAQVNTEYFIWPETAISRYADENTIRANPDYLQAQSFLTKYKNASLITGIESYKLYDSKKTLSAKPNPYGGGYLDNFNSAIQIENSAQVSFYHKSKLVPGAEKLPFPKVFSFIAPVFDKLGGSVSGWGWQEEPSVFYAQSGIGAAPVICYESVWGDWVGKAVKSGAQFIAIITNDGWWGNTAGKDQHFLYAKLRAIETRRWVVRSANTGISGFINQRGDVVKQSGWWERTALKADINLNDNLTTYVVHGDLIAQILSVFALIFALIIPYKTWIKKQ